MKLKGAMEVSLHAASNFCLRVSSIVGVLKVHRGKLRMFILRHVDGVNIYTINSS